MAIVLAFSRVAAVCVMSRSLELGWTASLAELGRPPRLRQAALELGAELVDRDPRLLERVAVAQRDGAVLERLVVDGHAPRRPDLVLSPVALADRAARVVLGGHAPAQVLVDL